MAAYAYFQIGENIIAKCAYYSYTESRLESIEGSGDMYESVDNFTVISYDSGWPYKVTWSDFVYAIKGTVTIPDGITSIANNFIYQYNTWSTPSTLIIGKDVKRIGSNAFANGGSATSTYESIIINSSVIEYIGDSAFFNQYSVEEINFNGSQAYIGDNAFSGCTSLKYLNLSRDLEYIGDGAFKDCSSLIEFNKGNRVGAHGQNNVFYGCNSIDHFEFTEKAEFNDSSFNRNFYVEIGKGSNQNEDGLQITRIKTNNIYAISHNWVGIDNRYPIIEEKPFILLNHLGRTIKINGYNSVDGKLPVNHNGTIIWCKLVEQGDSNASPLVFKHNGKLYWIGN